MQDLEKRLTGMGRSRRNLMKAGVIGAAAIRDPIFMVHPILPRDAYGREVRARMTAD
jgi:hypothetical protein